MCYSPEVSIGTFGFVTALCIYAWIRNRGIDRAASLLFFVLVLMQLVEYFLWMNQQCTPINKAISSLVPILLYLQPLLFTLISWKWNAGFGDYTPYIFYGWLLALLPALFYMDSIGLFNHCILQGSNGHLDWNIGSFAEIFTEQTRPLTSLLFPLMYYATLLYVFGTLKNTRLAAIFLGMSFVSFLTSIRFFKETWGSVWCHSVNGAAILALLV
jgi:hypothetical protein